MFLVWTNTKDKIFFSVFQGSFTLDEKEGERKAVFDISLIGAFQ